MSDKRKVYEIQFDGFYMGGVAIVRAINERAAWTALQKRWTELEPLERCSVKKLPNGDGVLYFDNGDY